MASAHFEFLRAEWPDLLDAAAKAENFANPDARTACFYARRALELAMRWLYTHDRALKLPYQDHLAALIHEPSFRTVAGHAIVAKAKIVKDLGNLAVHSTKAVRQYDALSATRELFHFLFWLARTYGRKAKPPDGLSFDPARLPAAAPLPPQTLAQLQKLEAELQDRDRKLTEILSGKAAIDAELERLRAEVAAAKAANAARPDSHDYSEAQTRDFFIDLLLKEAGWPLDQTRDREFEVAGMPNAQGKGFVDYVLWGDDGKPLALIEAKRTKRDPREGQQQAKLYADCLEAQFGRRPVIFYSNGYEHWIWDDARYPPRPIQGFLKKDELELAIQRRTTQKPLGAAAIDGGIVERFYQTRAIRRIGEAFERDHDRKSLVVMATGAGKTRTVIALCDLLMRCNWVKRVLFLADRVALVKQAVKAFKAHLPSASPVNLVTEKDAEGRVFVSTYPTMMGMIEESREGQRRFGVGHFDLVIIDEAHRSVYQKYRAIFEYFDSLLVGLTATPKDEIDFNTYGLFDLERGVPTDSYDLEEAVKDGLGSETEIELPGFAAPESFERFRAKARHFLKEHESHVAVAKLRTNRPLTATDLAELERMFADSGIGSAADIERAKRESEGLGLFVRSLIGLDREAAKAALAGFLAGKTPTADQIEFVNLIVDHLTEHGAMDAALLYASPYTDYHPQGVEGLFPSAEVDELVQRLADVRRRAAA